MVDIAHLTSDTASVRTSSPPLLPVLRSRLVGDLLALLATDPERWWTVSELAQRTGGAYPTVSREVRALSDAGLFETKSVGRTKQVRFDSANPMQAPLAQLALMAFGPVLVLGEELAGIDGIDEAFVFGSWASRSSGKAGLTPNDVDVLVLGAPVRDELHEAVRRAERRMGLPVQASVRAASSWAAADDAFARSVKSRPLIRIPIGEVAA